MSDNFVRLFLFLLVQAAKAGFSQYLKWFTLVQNLYQLGYNVPVCMRITCISL
jgi:hypothetical protein